METQSDEVSMLAEGDDSILGRPKRQADVTLPMGRVYPVPLQGELNDEVRSCPVLFHAKLLTAVAGSQLSQIQSGRAGIVSDPDEIEVLRVMGFHGYVPGEERLETSTYRSLNDCQDDTHPEQIAPTQLILFDVEILYLLHGLGCLDIELSTKDNVEPASDSKSPDLESPMALQLWRALAGITGRPSSHVADRETKRRGDLHLLGRYAAYLYYRARGWIVRPGLTLGGIHFLVYAQGPPWRHAAFAVLVYPIFTSPSQSALNLPTPSVREVTAHLRVANSVSKKLIICQVRVPPSCFPKFDSAPWECVRDASIQETLTTRWTGGAR